MSEVKKTTLSDRIRAAVRAFQGKPKDHIDVGVRVNRCSECKLQDLREVIGPKKYDKEVRHFYVALDDIIDTVNPKDTADLGNYLKDKCARGLLESLKNAGAITFFERTRPGPCPGVKEVHYEARIEVIMPEKEAEQ